MGEGRMRGGTAILGLGAILAVSLLAPVVAAATAPATLPLWIDPRLMAPPTPATAPTAAPAARFTVTRIAADGSRVTQAIDATALQSLSRPSTDLPPPVADPPVARARPILASARREAAPAPIPATASVSARAIAAPSDAALLRAAAKRLTLEPTWTALARQSLTADGQASLRSPDGKAIDGKAGLGLRDGRRYGETGRFYMYAAMKNKGVGMNVVDHGENWNGDGLSYDQGGFAGQRSAGVGWRKGEISTSLGWVHDKNRINGLYGAPAEKDDRLALTLSWRPKVPETAPPSK